MAKGSDDQRGRVLLETIDNEGKVSLDYQDLNEDELALELELELDLDQEPPPYHDESKDASWQILPTYEDLEAAGNNKKNWIWTAIVSFVTVVVCFCIIFAVLFYSLRTVETNPYGYPKPNDVFNTPPAPAPTSRPDQKPKIPSLNIVDNIANTDFNQHLEDFTPECQAAWKALTSLPCDDTVAMMDWDWGILGQINQPQFADHIAGMCDQTCHSALVAVKASLDAACGDQQVKGKFYQYFHEENSPPKIVQLLLNRIQHMCRQGGMCIVELQSKFGIMDGVRANGLGVGKGLNAFMNATRYTRIVGPDGPAGSIHHDLTQRFGPEDGSTTCSSCTLEWFKNSLWKWNSDEARLVSLPNLPHFLRIWQTAGRRCADGKQGSFRAIYDQAVDFYREAGHLQEGWEKEPSLDLRYILRNTPSAANSPFDAANAVTAALQRHLKDISRLPPSAEVIQHTNLVNEYANSVDVFISTGLRLPPNCYPFLSAAALQTSIFALEEDRYTHELAREACSHECHDVIYDMQRQVLTARSGPRTKETPSHLSEAFEAILTEKNWSLATFFGMNGTLNQYAEACGAAGYWHKATAPCDKIYIKFGVLEAATTETSVGTSEILTVIGNELSKLPEMPTELKGWQPPRLKYPTEEDERLDWMATVWKAQMDATVCNGCMYRAIGAKMPEKMKAAERRLREGTPSSSSSKSTTDNHLSGGTPSSGAENKPSNGQEEIRTHTGTKSEVKIEAPDAKIGEEERGEALRWMMTATSMQEACSAHGGQHLPTAVWERFVQAWTEVYSIEGAAATSVEEVGRKLKGDFSGGGIRDDVVKEKEETPA